MTQTLGICIETDFIEVSLGDSKSHLEANSGQWQHHRFRWNHQQAPEPLKEFLQAQKAQPDQIHFLGATTDQFIAKGQIQCPALLTTSGTEHWLEMQSKAENQISSEYISFVDTHDRVFPIFERTNAQGEIEKQLNLEELESLHAKFQLEEIDTLCVCYLNSTLNSENELKTAAFFLEKGYQVFVSSDFRYVDDEVLRWSFALRTAFSSCQISSDLNCLNQVLPDIPKYYWNNSRLSNGERLYTYGGFATCLRSWLSQQPEIKDFVFFGFDHFYFASQSSDFEEPYISKLKIQPMSSINSSIWGKAMVDVHAPISSSISLTPSLRPNVLDLLLLAKNSKSIPDVLESIDRTKFSIKLQELLFSFSNQDQPTRGGVAADKEFLENSTFMFILEELILSRVSDDIHVAGPLAPLVLENLTKVEVPFSWHLLKNYDFFKSEITCNFQTQAGEGDL